jgi:hypothetical protein
MAGGEPEPPGSLGQGDELSGQADRLLREAKGSTH